MHTAWCSTEKKGHGYEKVNTTIIIIKTIQYNVSMQKKVRYTWITSNILFRFLMLLPYIEYIQFSKQIFFSILFYYFIIINKVQFIECNAQLTYFREGKIMLVSTPFAIHDDLYIFFKCCLMLNETSIVIIRYYNIILEYYYLYSICTYLLNFDVSRFHSEALILPYWIEMYTIYWWEALYLYNILMLLMLSKE